MKSALDIHRVLLGTGVPHEIVRLRRPLATADDIPEVTGLALASCAVVRAYLVNELRLVAVVTVAGSHPCPQVVLDAVGGVTIDDAGADIVNQVTDYTATLCSPVLLPPDVTVLIDQRLMGSDVVYAPTGETGTLLGISTAHLVALTGGRVLDLDLHLEDTSGELAAAP